MGFHDLMRRLDRTDPVLAEFPLLQPAPSCPLCGVEGRQRAIDVYDNAERQLTARRRLALMGCERCGLVYSHPLPSDAELEAYYAGPGGWEARLEGTSTEQADEEFTRRLAAKHARYARELELLAPHLAAPRGGARRALDFGCGLGAWLDVLQDAGWETWGIEPGPRQREVAARRHRMVDAPPGEPLFDLVIVNHVLEHLPDPLTVARALATATVPGGALFVSVPDLSRLGEHGRWNYVKNERHICSYTPAAMRSLLGLAGFRPVDLDTSAWDDIAANERRRLKILGVRTGEIAEPAAGALDEAVQALEAYAARFAFPARRSVPYSLYCALPEGGRRLASRAARTLRR